MSYRGWIFRLILLTTGAVLVMALAQFIIDPLQYFRLAAFYRPRIDWNYSREFNAAFIRNFNYETVMIGSSLMGNCRVATMNRELDTRSLNLTIPGATLHEVSITLERSIRTGRLKKCILGMDIRSFDEDINKTGVKDFPYYLYDDDPFNNVRYIFNFEFFRKQIVHLFINNIIRYEPFISRIETAHNWIHVPKLIFSEERLLRNWIPAKIIKSQALRARISDSFFRQGKRNFDYNIYPYLIKNPQIEFYLLNVPSSILVWIDEYHGGQLEGIIKLKEYIYKKTNGLRNVKIYDFQTDETMSGNLNKYMDPYHFSDDINEIMIKSINPGRYLVGDGYYKNEMLRFQKQIAAAKLKYKVSP